MSELDPKLRAALTLRLERREQISQSRALRRSVARQLMRELCHD